MSAELYNQIYRCRKCGKEFCPVTTCGREKTKEHMDNLIDRANVERLCHLFLAPDIYKMHFCANGDIGVADFVGYERQEI